MTQTNEARLVDIRESALHWLVVRTKSRQEKIAVQHLRQRNVLPYCPLFQEPRWHARAPKGPVPLFAGYIFVRCEPQDRLNAVNFCPGVLKVITFGGRLATVGHDFITALKLKEGLQGHIKSREEEYRITIGHKVKVMDGPLRGFDGVFQGYLRGGQRAKVLLQFLRNEKSIEVDAMSLQMVS